MLETIPFEKVDIEVFMIEVIEYEIEKLNKSVIITKLKPFSD